MSGPMLAEATIVGRRAVETQPVNLRRATRSEWIKFRSLRSSWWMLVGAATGMVAIALVVAYNTRHLSRSLQLDDIVASAPMQGYYLGQLLIGSLGVLFVSGEYSTGMIRSTLAAVPKRIPVLWAKLTVFVVITAVTIIPISVVAFISAEGLISHFRTGFSLSDPGVLRVVIGTGVYLTLIGVIGATVGWLVRSTPGALVTYFALILVVPVLFGNVLGNWGKDTAQFLPSSCPVRPAEAWCRPSGSRTASHRGRALRSSSDGSCSGLSQPRSPLVDATRDTRRPAGRIAGEPHVSNRSGVRRSDSHLAHR